jgi:5-methyltetrahydrofolate--homocysteine methyltransferase
MSQNLINAIADMKEGEAISIVKEMVDNGEEAVVILEAVREAMSIIGQRYEEGAYFLPELMLSGEMMIKISEIIKSKFDKSSQIKKHGKVLIGTVKGDIHNIGKDIVTFMLDVNGYDVLDLGVDVPEQKFIDAIKDFQPQVVGLSGFLTFAFDQMKETIIAIKNAGLRENLKIMIGGGQIDEQVKSYTGADAYGDNAMAAVKLANKWIGG